MNKASAIPNKINPLVLVSLIGVILIVGALSYFSDKFFSFKEIHYHAGFIVIKDNQKIDFSDNKYMPTKVCKAESDKSKTMAEIQVDKAHLHDNIGDLVHVEERGAKWQDLFTNIKFPIDYSEATGYINGKKVDKFQLMSIRPNMSLVVFVGQNDPKFLNEAVTKEYIEEMSKKSGSCED